MGTDGALQFGLKARPNDCNTILKIVGQCCTVLKEVGKRMKHGLMQHLDSWIWDQNLPRNLRKQTRAILVCPKNWARPIDLRVGSSSRFSWQYSFTYSFALSLSIFVGRLLVRSPYCSLTTHAGKRETNIKKNKSSPWTQIPAKSV